MLRQFQYSVYDSSLGACLQSLHSGCSDDVVRSTAADIVRSFPNSMLKTRSLEVKASLCSVYVRIEKLCPPYSWRPECLISMLCTSMPIFHLIDCFKVAISRLGPRLIGRIIISGENHTGLPDPRGNEHDSSKVGGKRPIQNIETSETKRKRTDINSDTTCQDVRKFVSSFNVNGDTEYADFIISLKAISTLCIVFSEYPQADLSLRVFQQMCEWISWMFDQTKQELPLPLGLSIFLEAVDSLLFLQGSLPRGSKLMIFESTGDIGDLSRPVVKLIWNCAHAIIDSHPPWKTKCLSICILSMVGCLTQHISQVL